MVVWAFVSVEVVARDLRIINYFEPTFMLMKLREKIKGQVYEVLKPSLPDSAVLVAITDNANDPEVILTKRAEHMSSHAGEVCFPGGKWEDHDTSLLNTALRESHEEVGLLSEWVEVIGGLPPVVSRSGLNVVPYVGLISSDLALAPTSDELDSVFKVPLRYFMEQGNIEPYQYAYKGQSMELPSYVYEGYTIWGLTAYIIIDMLNQTYDASISLTVR